MKSSTQRFAMAMVAVVTLVVFAACEAGGVVGAEQATVAPSSSLARATGADRGDKTVSNGNLRINVLLATELTDQIRAELSGVGTIADEIASIDAVVIRAKANVIDDLRALPYVVSANPDAERNIPPGVSLPVEDFATGFGTWNLDAANVTAGPGPSRSVTETGDGVYVAVLDTGLVKNWRHYFPGERIAVDLARSFTGSDNGTVAEQPNKWEHDTDSHGTHVTSTVIGYDFPPLGVSITGVAPNATVIPVKVLNNNGSGWSSMVAAGITYIGDLKAGPLANAPVVINMSLGGPVLDGVEKAAIDYAIEQGVIIVASAGNEGEEGMGYPGAYPPVVSVAAAGWTGEWTSGLWWILDDVADPTNMADFYISDFSSRQLVGQDLDVTAPGSWVVGPYQVNQGQLSWYFLGGTSMASPHVAGIVALMAQRDAGLDQVQVETILEASAAPFVTNSALVATPSGAIETYEWGPDATGAGLVTADAALNMVPLP